MTAEDVLQFNPDNEIFASRKPLDPDVVPDKDEFICRDKQLAEVVNELQHLTDGTTEAVDNNFLVTGNTGHGKTAGVKIVLDELEAVMADNDITFDILFLSDKKTELNTLQRIAEVVGINYSGRQLSEYYERLKDALIEQDAALLLVIDEVDELFKNNRKDHGNSLLKRLLEVRISLKNADGGALTIVGITNDINTTDYFDPRVKSRFGNRTIHFPAYNAHELKKILKARADDAFKPQALEQGVVPRTAAMVAQEDGDARKAILLLRTAGRLAIEEGVDTVTMQHVDEARDRLEHSKVMEAVKSLSKQARIVMYAVIEEMLEEGGTITTGALYERYRDVCTRNGADPLTQRSVTNIVDDLDMMGLVQAKVVSKGRHGRTRNIHHYHDDELVQAITDHVEERDMIR